MLDKAEMLRRTKYNKLRGNNDYVILESEYDDFYRKTVNRTRVALKKKVEESNYKVLWEEIYSAFKVANEGAKRMYINKNGVLSRKNPMKDKSFKYVDIRMMFTVFVIEMYIKETEGASLKKDGLNQYLGYMYNTNTSIAFVDEILKHKISNGEI